MVEPIDSEADYVKRVAAGDETWRLHALCCGITVDTQEMFFCFEEDEIQHRGEIATGLQVQRYLVETFCSHCPVQWECLRSACADDTTVGVWGATGRDRRWLMKQRNPLGIIDTARIDKQAVSEAIRMRRKALARHPSMRPRPNGQV